MLVARHGLSDGGVRRRLPFLRACGTAGTAGGWRSLATVGALLIAACGEASGPASGLEGYWHARVFVVVPAGAPARDVLAEGGSLSIHISAGGRTSGTLVAPGGITGGTDLAADMSGMVRLVDGYVRFDQPQDTFVRYLMWSRSGDTLLVDDQPATTTRFTVRLVRAPALP